MPKNLLDDEKLSKRIIISLRPRDKAALDAAAAQAGLAVGRIAREALLLGLGRLATRRRRRAKRDSGF